MTHPSIIEAVPGGERPEASWGEHVTGEGYPFPASPPAPLIGVTGAGKQIRRICAHRARCPPGIPAGQNGGFGRLPLEARRGRE